MCALEAEQNTPRRLVLLVPGWFLCYDKPNQPKGERTMHKLVKNIVKKNSVLAVTGVISIVAGVVCLVAAAVKTVKDVRNTVNAALDDYAEKQLTK